MMIKKKLEALKEIVGKDNYSHIFDENEVNLTSTREHDFLKLSEIVLGKEEIAKLLKLANQSLINALGFEEWFTIVVYSFANTKINYLVELVEKNKINKFIKFYNFISSYINDSRALGVNKFLTIARFYIKQEDFCEELLRKFDYKNKLSQIAMANLQILIYRETESTESLNLNDLENLIAIEKRKLATNPNKDTLMTFLFNIDSRKAELILKTSINSKTIAQICSRAKKDKNNQLLVEANLIGIIIDIIENILYNYSDDNIQKIVDRLQDFNNEFIAKIRYAFGNIQELIRQFYEIEAQQELIDIDALKKNSEITKEYPGLEKGSAVKVIDVSNMKHTLYVHVYKGTDITGLFNTTRGKVTICVSPETDKHEAYYYDQSDDNYIKFGYTILQNGSYICSSTSNMGSNDSISYNNFEIKDSELMYEQRSIRESYDSLGDFHAETLLYRQGLIPTCLIINHIPPTKFQLQVQKQLQTEIRKIAGHENDEIVFVKTQGSKQRIFNYSYQDTEFLNSREITEKEKMIQELRKYSTLYAFELYNH